MPWELSLMAEPPAPRKLGREIPPEEGSFLRAAEWEPQSYASLVQ